MCVRKEILFSFRAPHLRRQAHTRSLFFSPPLASRFSFASLITNIKKCILIAFFFRFRFLFRSFVLLCKTAGRRRVICFGASSSAIRQSLLVGSLLSRDRADIKKARRCVINNQRQTMSRQMSQRTAARTTTTPTTHVQMGSTAINYTILHYNCAQYMLFYSSLCFLWGISIEFVFYFFLFCFFLLR